VQAGYAGHSGAAVALTAATAKTVIAITGVANSVLRLTEFGISFDGVTAGNTPVLVELCKNTQAGAGTNTDGTPDQIRGITRTAQSDIKFNYTAEPTALTAIKAWRVHPQTGIDIKWPLGREPEQAGATGYAIRVTAAQAVNCRVFVEWEEG